MSVRPIIARTLLSSVKQPDDWFGLRYSFNLYRGCQHHCIYCDSRSECYQIDDFDGEVLYKQNAIELLDSELSHKRVKGNIGTGSMNDPYMPLEGELGLMAQALAVIERHRFPVHILTKSDLVLRDVEVLQRINALTRATVSFTITTVDPEMAARVEPAAPAPANRLRAMASLAALGIPTGVLLMPVLPFLEDEPEAIAAVIAAAHEHGARHIVASFGVTLRDRQRGYFYERLDHLFPAVRGRYEKSFGTRYVAPARSAEALEASYRAACTRFGLTTSVPPYGEPPPRQLQLL